MSLRSTWSLYPVPGKPRLYSWDCINQKEGGRGKEKKRKEKGRKKKRKKRKGKKEEKKGHLLGDKTSEAREVRDDEVKWTASTGHTVYEMMMTLGPRCPLLTLSWTSRAQPCRNRN